MALSVVRGRRGGDVNPHRGVRAGGPPVISQRGRHLRQTWNTENGSSLLQNWHPILALMRITSGMTHYWYVHLGSLHFKCFRWIVLISISVQTEKSNWAYCWEELIKMLPAASASSVITMQWQQLVCDAEVLKRNSLFTLGFTWLITLKRWQR